MCAVFYGNTESANQSEKSFRANETETRERESECKHSIYIRTVSSEFLICKDKAGLGQKLSVLCMLLCPNGQ